MTTQINANSTNAEKIALSRSLFVGREDVLLQKNGYRVLRLLIEDVCTDLDAALDAIQGWLLAFKARLKFCHHNL